MSFKKYYLILLIPVFVLCNIFSAFAVDTPDRISLAVLNFKNNSPKTEWNYMEKAISEILSTNLSQEKKLRIIERSQLDRALQELKLNQSGVVDGNTAQRVGKVLGANIVVIGSITQLGDVINISARLINVETGEAITGETVRCTSENDLSTKVDELSRKMVNALLRPGETIKEPETSKTENKGSVPAQPVKVKKNIISFGNGDWGYCRQLTEKIALDFRVRNGEYIPETGWTVSYAETVFALHLFPGNNALKGFYWGPLIGRMSVDPVLLKVLKNSTDDGFLSLGGELGYRWIWNWFTLYFNGGVHFLAGKDVTVLIFTAPVRKTNIFIELNLGFAF